MDITLKLTNVVRNQSGTIDIEFEKNGVSGSYTFTGLSEMDQLATDPIENLADAAKILVWYWKVKNTALDNDNEIIGKEIHLKFEADAVVVTTLGPNPTLCFTQGL